MRWTIAICCVASLAAVPQAHAQTQADKEFAADLIGGAIGGGLAGVAGVLIGKAIQNAMNPPNDDIPVQASVRVAAPYAYSFANEGRSGVHYNRPCSTFDSVSGRLLPCDLPAAVPIAMAYGEPDAVVRRARSYAMPVQVPYVRPAHGYRSARFHGSHGRVGHARTVLSFRGGHR